MPFHHESLSRGSDLRPEVVKRYNAEIAYMRETRETHRWKDRAYNENLALYSEPFELANPNIEKRR